ncbi:MAG: OmpA family protein, partial [Flavobacteriia bacterium]
HKEYLKNEAEFENNLVSSFLNDGHPNTFNYFKKEFNKYLNYNNQSKIENIDQAIQSFNDLFFKIGVSQNNYSDYENYIKSTAPSDLAWVALQRLIEKDVKDDNWKEVKSTLVSYEKIFEKKNALNKVSQLIKIIEEKERLISFERLKGLNSASEEYAPVPSIDGKKMFFCGKDRKDNLGGEDVFESTLKKAEYSDVKVVSTLSTYNANEAPLSISADGNKMFMWSGDNNGDIMISSKQSDGSWSNPVSMGSPINSDYYEGDAMLSADGNSLIFVSSRPNGYNLYTTNNMDYYGDENYPTDIYICNKKNDGTWSNPINLGPTINTPYSERSPYLHPDGKTLYFSSEGHGGFGRMDVYKTQRISEFNWTSWKDVQNLGKEINTNENDWGFKFSTDGKSAFKVAKNQAIGKSSLILLLDVSGSMEGSKIEALKKSAEEVCLKALENNTEVAILAFGGECDDPIQSYSAFSNDALELTNFIKALYPEGRTPMYEAMYVAEDYMQSDASKDSKNKSIILMSDGDATSCFSLESVFDDMKKRKLNYKIHTIALEVAEYGRAYSDLTEIANETKGSFNYSATANDLGSAFAQATNNVFSVALKQANSDIFRFVLPEDLRPEVVTTIAGNLIDSKNKPINATIIWEDLASGKNIGSASTNPNDGSFYIVLPNGKNYGYYVENQDYFPAANNIDLTKSNVMQELQLNIDAVTYDEMINNQKAVIMNNLFFDKAKFELKPESYSELNRIIKIIKQHPELKIEISGHTDNDGVEIYNLDLSQRRAKAVFEYLITNGVDSAKLTSIGYGVTKPITDNSTEQKKAKNRRVELRFIK